MLVTDKELKSIVSDTRNLNIGRNYWQSGYVKKIKITADRNNHYLIKGVVDNDSYQNDCQITVDENNNPVILPHNEEEYDLLSSQYNILNKVINTKDTVNIGGAIVIREDEKQYRYNLDALKKISERK